MPMVHGFPSLESEPDALGQVQSLLHWLAPACAGVILVDRLGRVAWLSEAYARMLGLPSGESARGRAVEDVVPNSRMRDVMRSGGPQAPVDMLDLGQQQIAVARLPLSDADGKVVGAVGLVLADQLHTLRPVLARLQQLLGRVAAPRQAPAQPRQARHDFDSICGSSPACLALKALARRAAAFDANLVLRGETGTGKELLAHAIHAASGRQHGPFVALNIAAVPESLLEAEFFGVAPGAFTGAERRGREGKFQLADGGTLFLDEIGDMAPAVQAKLLRVLQEQEVEPLGSNCVQRIDVRVITATSADLEALVEQGRFRADLYYRLNALTLSVPPLRERLEDLAPLSELLLAQLAQASRLPQRRLAADGLAELARHRWPGNIRELRNLLGQAAMLADDTTLTAADIRRVLPAPRGTQLPTSAAPAPTGGMGLAEQLARAERQAITEALAATRGNKSRAAQRLGIARGSLYEKMAALQIAPAGH